MCQETKIMCSAEPPTLPDKVDRLHPIALNDSKTGSESSLSAPPKKQVLFSERTHTRKIEPIPRKYWADVHTSKEETRRQRKDACMAAEKVLYSEDRLSMSYMASMIRAHDSCHDNHEALNLKELERLVVCMDMEDQVRGMEENSVIGLFGAVEKDRQKAIGAVVEAKTWSEAVAKKYSDHSSASKKFAILKACVDSGIM